MTSTSTKKSTTSKKTVKKNTDISEIETNDVVNVIDVKNDNTVISKPDEQVTNMLKKSSSFTGAHDPLPIHLL